MCYHKVAGAIALAVSLSTGVVSTAAAADYDFSTIDVPGADRTEAYGINTAGQIVGLFSDTGGLHGFLKEGDTITSIDMPPGGTSHAFGINSLGQIVGSDGANGFLKDGEILDHLGPRRVLHHRLGDQRRGADRWDFQ